MYLLQYTKCSYNIYVGIQVSYLFAATESDVRHSFIYITGKRQNAYCYTIVILFNSTMSLYKFIGMC